MTHTLWTRQPVTISLLMAALGLLMAPLAAEDWPEMQGAGRTNTWNETGILRQFPADGLTIRWRTPVGGGFGGPAVAAGRVFVADYQKRGDAGVERVLALDEATGDVLWAFEQPGVPYDKFAYNSGPRATPTVDGDLVYALGAAGDVYCLAVQSGELRWRVNLIQTFQAKMPAWGFAAAPLVYGDILVCVAGGADDALLVGLNKTTGETVWKSLPSPGDIAYAPPVLVNAAGVDQLIHSVPGQVNAVNPQTGELLWQHLFNSKIPCATPVVAGDLLLFSDFYRGSVLLRLTADRPGATELWLVQGKNELNTDGLHSLMSTPVIKDVYIYGVCSHGQFRCLDAATGQRVWETMDVTREQVRWANAFLTPNGDACFINNDRGELIIADLSPEGYRELGRAQLIKPTSGGAGNRELGLVNWVIPAYANQHIIIRNDEEIISASLAE